MRDSTVLIVVAAGVLCFALALALIFWRLMRKTSRQAAAARERALELESRMRGAEHASATVVGAHNSALIGQGEVKVDLTLEVHPQGAAPYRTGATWLVELASLPQVQPGRPLQVRVDREDPGRIYPVGDWARPWPWS